MNRDVLQTFLVPGNCYFDVEAVVSVLVLVTHPDPIAQTLPYEISNHQAAPLQHKDMDNYNRSFIAYYHNIAYKINLRYNDRNRVM